MNWISIKDKLPEFVNESGNIEWSKKCLCYSSDKLIILASYTNTGYWKDWENGLMIKINDVTHWRNLPEPPKE